MSDANLNQEARRLRRRLDVAVAFKDAERGRPLTPAEKLTNLQRWIGSKEGEE